MVGTVGSEEVIGVYDCVINGFYELIEGKGFLNYRTSGLNLEDVGGPVPLSTKAAKEAVTSPTTSMVPVINNLSTITISTDPLPTASSDSSERSPSAVTDSPLTDAGAESRLSPLVRENSFGSSPKLVNQPGNSTSSSTSPTGAFQLQSVLSDRRLGSVPEEETNSEIANSEAEVTETGTVVSEVMGTERTQSLDTDSRLTDSRLSELMSSSPSSVNRLASAVEDKSPAVRGTLSRSASERSEKKPWRPSSTSAGFPTPPARAAFARSASMGPSTPIPTPRNEPASTAPRSRGFSRSQSLSAVVKPRLSVTSMESTPESRTIVIDVGSFSTKAGFAHQREPQTTFRSVVAEERDVSVDFYFYY